jgi:MFS family permease
VFFACLVIPGGALGDRLGRKGVLLTGLVVFAAGAAASAAAPAVAVMLVGRVLSGIGAACVLPNTLAVLLHATPRERRNTAIGVWASTTGVGGVIGNVGGGAVLSSGSWRWLFISIVPLSLVCALLIAALVPNNAGLIPHTVADALNLAHTTQLRAALMQDFTHSVDIGLRVMGIVTLLAGLLVLAQLHQARAQ